MPAGKGFDEKKSKIKFYPANKKYNLPNYLHQLRPPFPVK